MPVFEHDCVVEEIDIKASELRANLRYRLCTFPSHGRRDPSPTCVDMPRAAWQARPLGYVCRSLSVLPKRLNCACSTHLEVEDLTDLQAIALVAGRSKAPASASLASKHGRGCTHGLVRHMRKRTRTHAHANCKATTFSLTELARSWGCRSLSSARKKPRRPSDYEPPRHRAKRLVPCPAWLFVTCARLHESRSAVWAAKLRRWRPSSGPSMAKPSAADGGQHSRVSVKSRAT
jgi:hypothetical protein